MTDSIIKTKPVREAEKMAQAVLDAKRSGPIGLLIGDPGTGKTECGKHLALAFAGVRLCACEGESISSLARRLYRGMTRTQANPAGDSIKGSAAEIREAIEPLCAGRLLVMDQADKLNWRVLEFLRYLADEAGLGVFLIGTELLERTFKDGKTGIYTAQLASRIGAKSIRFHPFADIQEVTAYMIQPQFGQVDVATAKAFLAACRGYWREGMALADTCQRIMEGQKLDKLNKEVVTAAASFLAPGRA